MTLGERGGERARSVQWRGPAASRYYVVFGSKLRRQNDEAGKQEGLLPGNLGRGLEPSVERVTGVAAVMRL